MTSKIEKKLVAIVGPTASGKSDLGVKLALEFNGEIISADSRQTYKGLDVGSGKIGTSEMKGIPHHLLSIAAPTDPQALTLSEYLKLAKVAVEDIFNRKKIPFLVGGTGLYISALIEGYHLPTVPPDLELRKKLEKYSLKKLQTIYNTLDPLGFKKIDIANSRRLIRAIEVVSATKKSFFEQTKKDNPEFTTLTLGIHLPWTELKKRIHEKILARYPAMLEETKKLNSVGVSWERLKSFGLEYKWMSKLALKEIGSSEAIAELEAETLAYARRQGTWWKKRNVIWIENFSQAKKEVRKFLKT